MFSPNCTVKIEDFFKNFTAKSGEITDDLEDFGLDDFDEDMGDVLPGADRINWKGKYMRQLVRVASLVSRYCY